MAPGQLSHLQAEIERALELQKKIWELSSTRPNPSKDPEIKELRKELREIRSFFKDIGIGVF